MDQSQLLDAQYVIKCVKTGNTVEVYYAFLFDREFWAQLDQAAKFDDLAQAVTKMEAIAAGEADEGVFISLKEQLGEDVAALYVIRASDGAIMQARSFWGNNAEIPEQSKASDAFLLKVVREEEDDLYINVNEDAEIAVTVSLEEATRYSNVNLVREIIQQLQEASIGTIAGDILVEDEEGDVPSTDGWSKLKLILCQKLADYTQGVILEDDGRLPNNLHLHAKVTLEIVDINREETIEQHRLRTVVMIADAHHYVLRVVRESQPLIWLNKDGSVEEDFDSETALIMDSEEGHRLMQHICDMDEKVIDPDGLKPWQALKIRLMQTNERVWIEMIDVEAQIAVASLWLKLPFHLEPVQL